MAAILLLIPATSYRAHDFLAAARRLELPVIVGSNHEATLSALSRGRTLNLAFQPVGDTVRRIEAHARRHEIAAVIGTDDETVVLAAAAAKALGLPHNAPESVAASRDKHRFRQALARAGVRSPWFRLASLHDDLAAAARAAPYPCVLKPLGLSASVGVIRADDEAAFVTAARRIAAILRGIADLPEERHRHEILVEAFIPGTEVALEGLLEDGRLRVLALFDKPDPLDGPYFEETIYLTPSRLGGDAQRAIAAETTRGAAALGLRHGPVHGELRLNQDGPWLVELAARSIGGLCSRALSFGQDMSLETLILRHAVGLPIDAAAREAAASGVMMIPIPTAGVLRGVDGIEAARAVPGIDDVAITAHAGARLTPLPEGGQYPGFIFARAATADAIETALRAAHRRLRFEIAPAAS